MSPHRDPALQSPVSIRAARPGDEAALRRLAQLDGVIGELPLPRLLVAEVEEEILAALPLAGGRGVSDPFRPTAPLLAMLELRAGQLRDELAPRRGLGTRIADLLRGGRPAIAPVSPGNARLPVRD